MRPKIFLIGLFVASLAITPLFFASRAGKEFNDADAALNAVYTKLLASTHSPHQRERLIEAQRAWIKFRDADAALDSALNAESKGGLFHSLDLTNERIAYLKALLNAPQKEY